MNVMFYLETGLWICTSCGTEIDISKKVDASEIHTPGGLSLRSPNILYRMVEMSSTFKRVLEDPEAVENIQRLIEMAKRSLFKKKSGVTTPVLSKKKTESDADAVARLKEAGWNPDKVPYHVVDGNNVSELHAGEQADCSVCSRRKGKTVEKKSPAKEEKKGEKKVVKKVVKKKTKK